MVRGPRLSIVVDEQSTGSRLANRKDLTVRRRTEIRSRRHYNDQIEQYGARSVVPRHSLGGGRYLFRASLGKGLENVARGSIDQPSGRRSRHTELDYPIMPDTAATTKLLGMLLVIICCSIPNVMAQVPDDVASVCRVVRSTWER